MFFNKSLLKPFDLREASKFTNTKGESFVLSIRNATKGGPAELRIDEEIGEGFDRRGIKARDVAGFLSDNRGKPVDVKINSPGGLVFDGLTIYNALISHDGLVTTTITGIAASIASIIVQAGNRRIAYENSNFMCHRAIGVCVGNESDMQDCRVWLAKMDGQLAGIYSARSGQPKATMLNHMIGEKDGTLFNAHEALDARLIDQIIPNNNGRNATTRNPSNSGDSIDRIRDNARRQQMSAAAKRRVRELSHV